MIGGSTVDFIRGNLFSSFFLTNNPFSYSLVLLSLTPKSKYVTIILIKSQMNLSKNLQYFLAKSIYN